MFNWSINLFRIRGIQLALHSSFLLLLAYWAYSGYQDAGLPGMTWSAIELAAFFSCVVLHEMGHSFTGMHFGFRVRRILLMPIGGMAQFDSIPRQPKQELLMTLAGPAVNFVLAALLFAVVQFPDGWDAFPTPVSLGDVGRQLVIANLWMGIFNLVPAFPMDGGRILRALLATRLTYVRATFVAATVAKVLCGAALAYLFYIHTELQFAQIILRVVLIAFIFQAGEAEYKMVKQREILEARWREMFAQAAARGVPPPQEPPVLGP
jgi:Zn-dependent protease